MLRLGLYKHKIGTVSSDDTVVIFTVKHSSATIRSGYVAGDPKVAILLLVSQIMETSFFYYFLYVDAKIWINVLLEVFSIYAVLSRNQILKNVRIFCATFFLEKVR